MGLLDNFMSDPATILGLSVLNNANRPAAGLLQGSLLNNRLQAQSLDNQIRQAKILQFQQEQEAMKDRMERVARQREILGQPGVPAALPGGGFTGRSVQESQAGEGIIGGQIPPEQGLMQLVQQADDPITAFINAQNALKPPAGGTNITLSQGGQLDPFFEQLQKDLGKDFVDQKNKANDAYKSLQNSTRALALLNEGMTVGRGANALNFVGGALRQIGIDLAPDERANAQAYTALLAKQTAQIISDFGAGTGLSDADRQYAKQAAGGDIEMDEQALRKILRINAEANRNLIEMYNKQAAEVQMKGNVPWNLTVPIPELPDFSAPADITGRSREGGVEPESDYWLNAPLDELLEAVPNE